MLSDGCGHQAGHHKLICLCLPAAATLVRFVERRPHLFRLRRFPNSPVALVAVAPGAQAWLAYKRRLLQVGSGARSLEHEWQPLPDALLDENIIQPGLCRMLMPSCDCPLLLPQFIADHGPRVPLEALPRRPPDLPAELQKLVSPTCLKPR